MDNPVTFSDITLLNTLATCANMTTDEAVSYTHLRIASTIVVNTIE